MLVHEFRAVYLRQRGCKPSRVHENTVRNWAANGTLKSVRPAGARFHRFDPAEVERCAWRGRKPEPVGRDRLVIGPELADATQLSVWADRTEARTVFPRLVRRLLAATSGVEALTGRAGEGVGLGGWDAEATLREATPWLPEGDLRFEFGVSKRPAAEGAGGLREADQRLQGKRN